MRHSSWSQILIIGTVILLVPCKAVFSQDSVGYIEKIKGTVYWKPSENETEVQLDPKRVLQRPLHPGEIFRCGPNSRLVINLYGIRVTINEKMGSFPIPFATGKRRDVKKRLEEKEGTTGGRSASIKESGDATKGRPDFEGKVGGPNGNTVATSTTPDKKLTGTFRLDLSRSDDARGAAERATRNISYKDRQRVLDTVTRRLGSPTMLAIERRNQSVTIASSQGPQTKFDADGREHVEQTPDGGEVRVRASLHGDQLTVNIVDDKVNHFDLTFDPLDNGSRLRVTRRLKVEGLEQPVEAQSVYDRTSEVAQWNVYPGYPNYPGDATEGGSDYFIVPSGTQLVANLNNDLSTKRAREGDRFSMTVREPLQYNGATIEGYVSRVARSGRTSWRSAMTLNFERIRLRDGRSYRFTGLVESVRTSSGEVVRVEDEGSIRESTSTTSTTSTSTNTSTTDTRASIGTAVGAIIGAIAGGGKGAEVGAAVGASAGTGASSVYVEGRDDLEIKSGTELTISTSAPR